MPALDHKDLNALGDRLTLAFRHEIELSRAEAARMERGIYRRIDELKEHQVRQNGKVEKNTEGIVSVQAALEGQCERIDRVEDRQDGAVRDVAAIDERTKNVSRGLGISLNRKHKALLGALVTLILGAAADGIAEHWREIFRFVFPRS